MAIGNSERATTFVFKSGHMLCCMSYLCSSRFLSLPQLQDQPCGSLSAAYVVISLTLIVYVQNTSYTDFLEGRAVERIDRHNI